MKINEIINEGILGAIGKGIGAGLGMNPTSTADQYQRTNHLSNAAQITKNKNTVVTNLGIKVTKASNGRWYDGTKEIITNTDEIAKLDQLLIDKQSNKEQMNWNADSGILNISGIKYKRINDTDWKDVQTGDTLKNPADINAKFDIASGRINPNATPAPKVDPNKWVQTNYTGNGNLQAQQPQVQPATQSAPVKKPRTGGKVPGQVSQTPNAQRKRAARQPQVFSSNRPK